MTLTSDAPLLDALRNHVTAGRLGFHTPGHQNGKGLPSFFKDLLSRYGGAVDLTELTDLDNLAAPRDAIARSEEAMARVAGSKRAYYMVNGASGGLIASMLAMSGPGAMTIIPEHCHTSIYQGLILTGAMPLIIPCVADKEWGLPIGIDWGMAESRLTDLSDGTLWVSLNPTYHGVMANLAHEKSLLDKWPGVLWLVDEAHGAHLPFISRRERPKPGLGSEASYDFSAIQYMADVIAHSAHKMGTGLTQTGIAHCNRASLETKLRQAVNITQTTSPSYLLLASLDAWQAFLREEGANRLRQTQSLALELSDRIRALGVYRLWRDELAADHYIDPQKITLSAWDLGISGSEMSESLRLEYNIDVELADNGYILLIVNLGHEEEDIERLVDALRDIKERCLKVKTEKARERANPGLAAVYTKGRAPITPAITPREAFFKARELVPISRAAGRLSAGFVTPYPPGIPLLFPGMEISEDALEIIASIHTSDKSCAGLFAYEGKRCIEVINE